MIKGFVTHANAVPSDKEESLSTATECLGINFMKVKSMKRPGSDAVRTQTQPSKPKREITKITNSQNTLPHNLIKEKLPDLIERTFYKKEGKLYLACNDKKAIFHFCRPL